MEKRKTEDEIKGKMTDLDDYFNNLRDQINDIAKKNPNWAIEMGLNWLERNQNDDGGYGIKKGRKSVIHITALAFLALSKSKYHDKKHDTIRNIIGYLKKTQNKEGWWSYEEKSVTGSIGVTGIIIQALHNMKVHHSKDMYRKASEYIRKAYSFEKSCWRDNEFAEFGEVSVNEAAFNAIPDLLDKQEEKDMRELLVKSINADEGYGKNFYYDSETDESDVENTALSLKIMKNLKMDLNKSPVKEALNYIISSQEPNGGFPRVRQILKRNSDAENDATALAISGLMDMGLEAYNPVMHSAASFILNNINIDGGWGDASGMDSDTDTTALAVMALMDVWETVVPLSDIKLKINDTKSFLNGFIEKHVEHLENELFRGNSLSRVLEIIITLLGILIPVIIVIFQK